MDKSKPTQVGTGKKWKAVAAGETFSCGLRSDGTLWCWGENYGGSLGVGDAWKEAPVKALVP